MAKIDVSIAMATYNGSRHIAQQLESLARQTHTPSELVICDDGSSDDTLDAVEAFRAHAPFPVRVHRNPATLGYVQNFLHAAGLCRSGVVALCDQDDTWDARKLELCLPAFEDERVLLCYHDVRLVKTDGELIEVFDQTQGRKGPQPPSTLWPGRYPWGLSQLFRHSLLSLVAGLRRPRGYHAVVRIGHDELLAFVADACGWTYAVDECLVDYRQHGGNASGGRLAKGGLLSQVRRREGENLGNIAASLGDQSACLAEFRATCDPALRINVDRAIQRTAVLGRQFAKRAALYDAETFLGRSRRMAALAMDYRPGSSRGDGLPARALVRDLAYTMLGPVSR